MAANVIEIEGLRKDYRGLRTSVAAVDGLDLVVPEGGVFGFLGANGSGKTTTIRCLLGLVRPTAGSVRLLGGRVPEALPAALRRVGSIVEAPALFPTISGRENLRLLAAIDRISPTRVEQVLEEVGLAERAGQVVKKYSLGMRQRLALAAALLKDPALLVLDEPANGLDPGGIRQVRDLVRRLGDEGRTVFVSSHILTEVQQMADHVAILRRGRSVASGSVAEVLAPTGTGAVLAQVADLEGGLRALRGAGLGAEQRGRSLRVEIDPADAATVTQVLAEAGHWVTELRADERSLEDLFLELTSDDLPTEEVAP